MTLDLSTLYAATGTAQLAELPAYARRAVDALPSGEDVTLTGPAPVWLYLKIAHALHGRAKALFYDSPVTGKVEIFNHDPFARDPKSGNQSEREALGTVHGRDSGKGAMKQTPEEKR